MIPALERFAKEVDFNISFYRKALDHAWNYLEKGKRSSGHGQMAEECLDRAPDTEEFDQPLTSAALNAALAIAATINFLSDGDVDHVLEAAGLARDTAALYAQAIETTPPRSLSFDEVMTHRLVQQELRQQAEDLKFLEALPDVDSRWSIERLKERASETPGLLPPEIGR
jgi:uncharacterized protein YjaG (DUF416 family)